MEKTNKIIDDLVKQVLDYQSLRISQKFCRISELKNLVMTVSTNCISLSL